jgi:hypothetical protein
MTEDEIERACAWSDYRRDYGVSPDPVILRHEHEAFKAGWDAAKRPEGSDGGPLR